MSKVTGLSGGWMTVCLSSKVLKYSKLCEQTTKDDKSEVNINMLSSHTLYKDSGVVLNIDDTRKLWHTIHKKTWYADDDDCSTMHNFRTMYRVITGKTERNFDNQYVCKYSTNQSLKTVWQICHLKDCTLVFVDTGKVMGKCYLIKGANAVVYDYILVDDMD